jgi:hypothetical protein
VRLRAATAATAIAICCSCCSLFTSLSGFSNGDDDSAGKADGASVDALSVPEGSVSGDGGNNSSVDANTPFCTAHATAAFCADFDRVSKFDETWTGDDIDPTSTVAFAESTFTSSPRSLRVALPAKGPGIFYALLSKTVNTTERRPLRLELDLFVTQPIWAGTGNVSFFSIGYSGPQLDVSQELFLNSDNTSALTTRVKRDEPNSLQFSANAIALPRNQWVHVKVETNFKTGGDGFVRIWFNDQEVVNKVNTLYQAGAHEYAYVNIGFGRYDNGATPAFEAFYDNVLFDFF